MRKLRDRVPPVVPEDFLRLALAERSPLAAGELAKAGLALNAEDCDPESAVLLLREVFKSHVHAGRARSAHAIARKMIKLGALPEVAHADLGRACAALGWSTKAAQAYRLAARFAPARRRALHWAACASALHNGERYDESLAALERAIRWSTATRPLHRAYGALVLIDQGENVPDLATIETELESARCGEGYGRYVLGLLAMARGDQPRGRRFLREFIRRNTGDAMRLATLSAEIARARKTLKSPASSPR